MGYYFVAVANNIRYYYLGLLMHGVNSLGEG